jgi:hypothetical protein
MKNTMLEMCYVILTAAARAPPLLMGTAAIFVPGSFRAPKSVFKK